MTGTFTWPDGMIYVGNFENDHMGGVGTLTYANGRMEERSKVLGNAVKTPCFL